MSGPIGNSASGSRKQKSLSSAGLISKCLLVDSLLVGEEKATAECNN